MERKVNETGGRVQTLIGGEMSSGWMKTLTGGMMSGGWIKTLTGGEMSVDDIEDHIRKWDGK